MELLALQEELSCMELVGLAGLVWVGWLVG
jgi:hypothetical protein